MTVPRILLTLHGTERGGTERLALLEAERLAGSFNLTIAAPAGPLRDALARHGRLVKGPPCLPLWGASAKRWAICLMRTGADALRLASVIRRGGIEAVVVNSAVSLSPVLAARLVGVPVIVHVRDWPQSRLAGAVLRVHCRLADTLITIAEAQRPLLGTGPARIVKIHDGIAVPPPPENLPDRFGRAIRLCVVGALDRRKGQDVAIRALARLRADGLDASLAFAGRRQDAVYARELEALTTRLGQTEHVTVVGEVDGIDGLLADVDIVLVPSRGEWTPLVIMEALVRAKPVIAAAVGGVPEVVRDRVTGVLVPASDDEALAAAVCGLVADAEGALAMAARGWADIAGRFDLQHTLADAERELRLVLQPRT